MLMLNAYQYKAFKSFKDDMIFSNLVTVAGRVGLDRNN